MNVLITSAGSESGRLLAESLSGSHKLRLTDEPGRAGEDVVACEFGHDEATDDLCEGINAIVHVCEPDDDGCRSRRCRARRLCEQPPTVFNFRT
jgi:hypothetical protein